MAEWLRRGLQILARRFDSGSGLHIFHPGPARECAALAQLVEHIIRNDGVTCSSHVSGTTFFPHLYCCKPAARRSPAKGGCQARGIRAGNPARSPEGRIIHQCLGENWSGRRDSNPRPQPWQGTLASRSRPPRTAITATIIIISTFYVGNILSSAADSRYYREIDWILIGYERTYPGTQMLVQRGRRKGSIRG